MSKKDDVKHVVKSSNSNADDVVDTGSADDWHWGDRTIELSVQSSSKKMFQQHEDVLSIFEASEYEGDTTKISKRTAYVQHVIGKQRQMKHDGRHRTIGRCEPCSDVDGHSLELNMSNVVSTWEVSSDMSCVAMFTEILGTTMEKTNTGIEPYNKFKYEED